MAIRLRSLSSLLSFLLSFILAGAFALVLTGCTLAPTAPDASVPGTALQGKVYGGNQPVVGAHVYLMAAMVSGVGPAGYGLASTSLLKSSVTGLSDSVGAYVLTDSNGAFRLDAGAGSSTYDYTCPSASTQVYLYVLGGNPGAGTNSADGFMAALGSCGNLSTATLVSINELTTVATAYSLAGFATDALHVSIPQYANATQQTNNITDALAQTDLQNAFANVNNLVNVTTGAALATTPAGNGTPVTAQVITLGNILAACVNASDASPANCTTLFNNALSGGSSGTTPTETATAAIDIAHNPYVSATVMSSLFGLQAASGAPFAGGDSAQPTDFTVAINFTGGGLNAPDGIAIDGSGNAWTANSGNNSVGKFSSSGTPISSSFGYTGGGLNDPSGMAIDDSGNAWTTNYGNSISEFSSNGMALSGSGYTGGGLNLLLSIAIDGSGNVWTENYGDNTLSKFSSGGLPISSSSGYAGGGLNEPYGVAIDGSGNAWTANLGNFSISEFSPGGVPLSGSGYTGGGLNFPKGIAIDGSGNAWTANSGNNSVGKFSSSGTPISSSSGYTGGGLNDPESIAIDGSGNAWTANRSTSTLSKFSSSGAPVSPASGYTGGGISQPYINAIAVDGSGNVWIANNGNNSLTELVGAATPVVTPLPANLIAPYSAPASKP